MFNFVQETSTSGFSGSFRIFKGVGFWLGAVQGDREGMGEGRTLSGRTIRRNATEYGQMPSWGCAGEVSPSRLGCLEFN